MGTEPAAAGESYSIVVESGSEQGNFALSIVPVQSEYENWRASFFEDADPEGLPPADPDGDGMEVFRVHVASSPFDDHSAVFARLQVALIREN